jgi:hypothetical protein
MTLDPDQPIFLGRVVCYALGLITLVCLTPNYKLTIVSFDIDLSLFKKESYTV